MSRKLYDWEEWFSRSRFTLWRGRDYLTGNYSFVQQLRNAATQRGLKISVEEDGNRITVTVRECRDAKD